MFAARQKKKPKKKTIDDRCGEERGKTRQKMEKGKYVGRKFGGQRKRLQREIK